jgi:iron complex transport system substrate-binding protein
MKKTVFLSTIMALLLVAFGGVFVFLQPHQVTQQKEQRVVATTMAMTEIFDRLAIPLVGVPTSSQELPKRYADLPKVGNHTNVNFEQIVRLKPSVVYVDEQLTDDYASKLAEQQIAMQPVNLQNYTNLQQTITQLGNQFKRQSAARALNEDLQLPAQPQTKVKVLILMGMPGGSFLVANEKSYIGDLVQRAGGQVIGGDSTWLYTAPNAAEIARLNPDIVIRLAHAMPENVKKSFDETFKQVPYRDLKATKNHAVYDGEAPVFSPTANLHVKEAYRQIMTWIQEANDA